MTYGWFANHPTLSIKQIKSPNKTKKRWHYSVAQSDMTKFAQHYYRTMGTTLFSKPKASSTTSTK